ncbi:MAG: arylsulfatase [Thermoguttaceae bacterium]
MRIGLIFLTVSLLPRMILLQATDEIETQGRPNVLVVVSDDQGFGDLGCHGNPILKTPHMDRLYDESVRLDNFHVDSYCTPTRSALMTGRYAHRVGGWGTVCGRNMLRDGEVTMADVFRHNGYRTGLFGKWHLGTNYPYRPMDRGFDEWLGHGDGGTGCTTDHWGNDRVNDTCIHNGRSETVGGYETDVFYEAAMRFIRADKDRPFLVYLASYAPHSPCSVADPDWVAPYRGQVPPRTADFYASIARVDENLGRLRAFLEDEGLAENTLLVFMTDNGTAEGEKVFNAGMRGKKGSPYDGGHRVPCFVHWPAGGLDRPVTVDRLAAHLDLLPTLVDLCGLKLPRPVRFDGVSLRSLLADPRAPWPERQLELGTPRNQVGPHPTPPRHGENCAVMTDRWRLVNDRELYDMTADPGQKRDLAGEQPEVVSRLREVYRSYWTDVSAQDEGWRGRPIVGADEAPLVDLCAEDWYPTEGNCPWNQAAVASGGALFGHWPVRIAKAGAYRVEVRRWPREADGPLAGVPLAGKTADAWLGGRPVRGLLYGGAVAALPVARVRLRIGDQVQEAAVQGNDRDAVFPVRLVVGPADVEATLLDSAGRPLCGGFYVTIAETEKNP